LEPTKHLKTLGDTAAAMGKRLDEAVEAFADAATGEFERLKEFGIKAKTQGDRVTFSWVQNGRQLTKTVEKTGTVITETLSRIWSDRFDGGMERLSRGWTGMWSNLQDQITLFAKAVMESGVFDYMKERLSETLATLTRMTADGSLKEMAQDIGWKLTKALEGLRTSLKSLVDLWISMPGGTSSAVGMGILGNLLFGPKGAAIIGGGTYLLQSLSQSVEGFKRSISGDISFWEYMWSDRMELEDLLDQADRERLAKQRAQHAQMDALDAQRTKNLEAGHASAHSAATEAEQEYASKIKAIQDEVTLFRGTQWDKIEKDIKATLKELVKEEEKYAQKVKELQEERRMANLSTEEKIRSMLRGTMTEYQAYQDRQAEANESLVRARAALVAGDGGEAEFWARKAQDQFADLTGEVKDGERAIISAAQAQATAVQGVRDAGKALSDSIQLRERAAEEMRKGIETQATQARNDLQGIRDLQQALDDVELLISVQDGASPTMENLQRAAEKLSEVRMRISAEDQTAHGVNAAKIKAAEIPPEKITTVTARDDASPVIDAVKTGVSSIPDRTVSLNSTDQASPVLQGAAAAVASLPDAATVNISAQDNATGTVRWIETETGRLLTNKTVQVDARDNATPAVDAVIDSMGDIPDAKRTTVTAEDEATAALRRIQGELARIRDKIVTVTVRYRKEGDDGRASGGHVSGLAGGGLNNFSGRLPGYSLTDNLLAVVAGRHPLGLAGGEFVTNALSTRIISGMLPGFQESLNRIRSASDLKRLFGMVPGRAGGGPVSESFRATLVADGREAAVTTSSRAEFEGLKALVKGLNKTRLVYGG